jgi:O-antigen/teichoic acid export membrane protein
MDAELSPPLLGAPGAVLGPDHGGSFDELREIVATEAQPTAAPAADQRQNLTRNFLALLSGQMVTWTMTAVWTLIVPRALGPSRFGLITAAASISGMLGIVLGFGSRPYLVREMVMQRGRTPRLLGTAFALRAVMTPVVAVAAVVFVELAHYRQEEAVVVYLATAATVLTALSDPPLAAFQAIERMKYMALSDVINKTAQSVIGIALALAGLGAVAITANMAVAAGAVVALDLFWLKRYVRIEMRSSARAVVRMVKDSFSYWAASLFFTIYLWIDTIMLSMMTNTKVVGWYGATTTLFQTLMFIPGLTYTAWLPRLVESYKGGRKQGALTARQPVELVLVISAPLAAGTAITAKAVIPLLYGSAYGHAVPAMVILGLCLPSTYMGMMMGGVLASQGRQGIVRWLLAGATVVNPMINLVLIRWTQDHYHNGAVGAAIALLVTESLITGGIFVFVRDVFNRASLRRWVLSVCASAAMWCVAYVTGPLGTVVALSAGVATLLVLIFVWRIPTDEEMVFIRRTLHRLRAFMLRS